MAGDPRDDVGGDDDLGLSDLLTREVPPHDIDLDPGAIRGRVARRRRRARAGLLAGLALVLVTLPLALIGDRDATEVRLDQPTVPPAETPVSQEQTFTVDVAFALVGPLASSVALEPEVELEPVSLGHPLLARASLLLRPPDGDAVTLPAPTGGTWQAQDDGLAVTVSPPPVVEVFAGGPPGSRGTQLGGPTAPDWAPMRLAVAIESTDLLADTTTRQIEVPLGEDALRITVTFTPQAATPPVGLMPVDATGTVLNVPPLGTAQATRLSDTDAPVWISHTALHGVTVVDARTPRRLRGVMQLARWCPSSEGFIELQGASQFTADGTYTFGPTDAGMGTYRLEPADEGQVRIIGADRGAPRPPPEVWPIPTGEFGEPLPGRPAFAGPQCGGAEDTESVLDVYPSTDLDGLANLTGTHRIHGRLRQGPGANAVICTPVADPLGCGTPQIPVDLTDQDGHDASDPEQVIAWDAAYLVDVDDGTITDVLMDGGTAPPAVGSEQPFTAYSLLVRVVALRLGEAAEGECPTSDCVGIVDVERIQLLDDTGRTQDPADIGDQLPEGWLVTTEPGIGESTTPLALVGEEPDGDTPLNPGDLVTLTFDHRGLVADARPFHTADR